MLSWMIINHPLASFFFVLPGTSLESWRRLFLKKLDLGMSLTKKPLKFCNPGPVLVFIPVSAERFFGIFGQLFSPSGRKARMDSMLSGDFELFDAK
jgi:hypothetical protein